jgi:hypothetical protein
MSGGIIQLAARGVEDLYLIEDPQITFFKTVYRRHTNFAIETIPQYFSHKPDFEKKTSCTIHPDGDLISDMHLSITLPEVQQFTNSTGIDNITKFSWSRNIAFVLIDHIEIEINGQVINRNYGEWMYIWFELTQRKDTGNKKMYGMVSDLYEPTNGKQSYTLYVPLQFWFCKNTGMALPMISLQYSDVKVNLQMANLKKCYNVTPTHYITLDTDIVTFSDDEYIEQTVDDVTASGKFVYYDVITKRLYYTLISSNNFTSVTISDISTMSNTEINTEIYSSTNEQYYINGLTSKSFCTPYANVSPRTHSYLKTAIKQLKINDCHLIIDFIYLDEEERAKFAEEKHEYILNQVSYNGQEIITNTNRTINIGMNHPTKLLVWILQYSYLYKNNDFFNYTDDYKYDTETNLPTGNSLITDETLLLCGRERMSMRNYNYFDWVQNYEHFNYYQVEGINTYSFSLYPLMTQTTGTCDMSQLTSSSIQLSVNHLIQTSNPAYFRSYYMATNVLRVSNGLSGLVF